MSGNSSCRSMLCNFNNRTTVGRRRGNQQAYDGLMSRTRNACARYAVFVNGPCHKPLYLIVQLLARSIKSKIAKTSSSKSITADRLRVGIFGSLQIQRTSCSCAMPSALRRAFERRFKNLLVSIPLKDYKQMTFPNNGEALMKSFN